MYRVIFASVDRLPLTGRPTGRKSCRLQNHPTSRKLFRSLNGYTSQTVFSCFMGRMIYRPTIRYGLRPRIMIVSQHVTVNRSNMDRLMAFHSTLVRIIYFSEGFGRWVACNKKLSSCLS